MRTRTFEPSRLEGGGIEEPGATALLGVERRAMHDAVIQALRCPHCREPFEAVDAGLRCPHGHAFDRARQGYVNLLAGRDVGTGDSAQMVAARDSLLQAGHFAPLAEALADASREVASEGIVVEVGAGTGYYVSRVLDALPTHQGLALDLSRYAARRAARAHPRLSAIVADAWQRLPLADACAALVLNVFAPRQADELHRVLRPDGLLVVVTPTPRHLETLRASLELIAVDPSKEQRLAETFSPRFQSIQRTQLDWTMHLDHDAVRRLVGMGPSARHLDAEVLDARVARLPASSEVPGSVTVDLLRPLQQARE